MDIGCCLTSDILWSFLMTVLPAEIIRPSFFHINVLRSKSIIAVDDVDEDNDDIGYDDDIYIMMKCLSVCLSRKIITSSWESPVTTETPHNHPVQLQVSFDGFRLVFHGSMSVFIGFQGFRLV